MCSHKGAFRIATNLRLRTMEHIVKLPLGFAEQFGSGRLRKIVNESSAATETHLAHQLPDRANAIATPAAFWSCCWCSTGGWDFEPRAGCVGLPDYDDDDRTADAGKMKEYQNALDDMSNEAVEYVRGIPVVKTFGQTIFFLQEVQGFH